MTHVYVVHVWDGTNDSGGGVRVYADQNHAEREAWFELDGVDQEACDFSLPESMKLNGYILHAVYGPNDAVVSVRRVPVR